ncbi:ABC transporter ATP-binding protein [Candidatus Saccharibacteria bacterium]|nr:ABC transporter ATP-binding protein [Candidatus Saccharibacteria bacterium]
MDSAVRVENLGKTFKLPHERYSSLKSSFVNFRPRRRTYELQQALKDVSFEIKPGEFFGIVGRNGSGKSTLLKLLAGIYTPTSGVVKVNGSLTPFIELGVGFNPELTGRENIFLNGALLGFSRKEMQAMYDDIVEFAELRRFMDQKLKNYSSGMEVRLAFSIAIKVNSDILLLDEVLAVGDAAFQKKCFNYFRQLKKDKKTVVFISHDMNAVREYCDRAILLEKGKILKSGSAEAVAQEYIKLFMTDTKTQAGADKNRWGSGAAKIKSVQVTSQSGKVRVTIDSHFKRADNDPVIGIYIKNPIGIRIFESNTKWERINIGDVKAGQKLSVTWEIDDIFTNGIQTITAALSNHDATDYYDWWEEASIFSVDKDKITTAIALPNTKVTIKKS